MVKVVSFVSVLAWVAIMDTREIEVNLLEETSYLIFMDFLTNELYSND